MEEKNNEELIENPGNVIDIDYEKKSCIKKEILIIFFVIAIIGLSVIGIIFGLTISREQKNENENKNEDNSLYELDTIPPEEMAKARKSFKQYVYEKNCINPYVSLGDADHLCTEQQRNLSMDEGGWVAQWIYQGKAS